jgi:ADP-heptose:LPS heptosyltransferase
MSPAATPSAVPFRDPGIRRVALVRLRVGLGDLLCSAPAIRALRAGRSDLHLTLVTWPKMAPLARRLGGVDQLLPFPGIDGIPDRPPRADDWHDFQQTAVQQSFDLALQCYGDNPVANTVTASLGARVVGGFAPTGWTPPRGSDDVHLPYPTDHHEVDRHLMLMEKLGVRLPADAGRLTFPVTDAEERTHQSVLGDLGLVPRQYAVLHPGASSPSRRWPLSSFAEVARELSSHGLRVVVTGTVGERDLGRRLAAHLPFQPLDLTGSTSLAELALLLRDSAVLVGNDTGTAHLAEAVGASKVTIFQPGDPRRWGYRGSRSRLFTPDVACAPCPHLTCPIDFRCSRATKSADVMQAVEELINR